MKLVRFGAPGREKPGIIDGKIRDLSNIVPDIAGETLSPKGLNKIKKADLSNLPPEGRHAARPLRRRHAPFRRDRPELCRSRRRNRRAIPKEPIIFQKAPTASSARTTTP